MSSFRPCVETGALGAQAGPCGEAPSRPRGRVAIGPVRLYARAEASTAATPHAMERPLDPTTLGDHLDRLFRAAWALTGSREDAEDLVQETYVKVLSRPRFIRNEDDLGYLLRALRNTFLNRKRSERARLQAAPLPDDLDLIADPHARQPEAALEAGELYAAVASLPDDFRDVLVAVDVAGLSYKETAPGAEDPRGHGDEPALPRAPAGRAQARRGLRRVDGAGEHLLAG